MFSIIWSCVPPCVRAHMRAHTHSLSGFVFNGEGPQFQEEMTGVTPAV